MDRQGVVLIWCRKCSDYARQKVGPQLMICWKPEQVGTKEYGKMLKRIQILEDGRVLAKEATNWKIEGDCGLSSKRKDSWHRKVHGISPERKCCQTGAKRGKEKGRKERTKRWQLLHKEAEEMGFVPSASMQ